MLHKTIKKDTFKKKDIQKSTHLTEVHRSYLPTKLGPFNSIEENPQQPFPQVISPLSNHYGIQTSVRVFIMVLTDD